MQRQVFVAINIPCKFDEDIFIIESDVKVYVKNLTNGCTNRHMYTETYNLWTTAFAFHGLSLQYEAIEPLIREK